MTRIPPVLLSLLLLPTAALAQDAPPDTPKTPRIYAGIGFEVLGLEDFDLDGSLQPFGENTGNITLRGGIVAHRFIAIEGEAAFSTSNSDMDGIADYGGRFGAFVRPRLPIYNNGADTGLEVFTRLGYATSQVTSRSLDGEADLDGLAYGGGIAYSFLERDKVQVRLDLTRYEYGSGRASGSGAISLSYQF